MCACVFLFPYAIISIITAITTLCGHLGTVIQTLMPFCFFSLSSLFLRASTEEAQKVFPSRCGVWGFRVQG